MKSHGDPRRFTRQRQIDPGNHRRQAAAGKVAGRILKIGDDSKTFEISIGGDDGIAVGDTLEIFTTSPPNTRGMMKIIDIRPERAVANWSRRTRGKPSA